MDFKTCKPLAQSLQPKTCQHTQSLLPTAPNILQLGRSPSPLPTTRWGLKAPFLHIGTKTMLFCCCWFFFINNSLSKAQGMSPGALQQVTVTVYIHIYCIYPFILYISIHPTSYLTPCLLFSLHRPSGLHLLSNKIHS